MFYVIKSLIKTSWYPTVVFSLKVLVCNFSMPLRTSEGKVSIKTDASKSKNFKCYGKLKSSKQDHS